MLPVVATRAALVAAVLLLCCPIALMLSWSYKTVTVAVMLPYFHETVPLRYGVPTIVLLPLSHCPVVVLLPGAVWRT